MKNQWNQMNGITGASYIGKPMSHTVMYLTKKVEGLLSNLEEVEHCFVFCDESILISDKLQEKHYFIKSVNPQLDYVSYVNQFAYEKEQKRKNKKYKMTEEGYYVGENVTVGKNAVIEPLCFIDHDVIIGDNAKLCTGSKIRNAVIGNDFIANENAVIGSNGFTMAHDEKGNLIRIPNLGKAVIGNHVEVGMLANIAIGSAGDTSIGDYVKIDSFVHIAHDVTIKSNVEITAGSIIGGFVTIEDNVFIGINSTVRNRIVIGDHSLIGMGSVVTKQISPYSTVVGNPAKPYK